jgi:aromatic-L-amino-acid decarboxylase
VNVIGESEAGSDTGLQTPGTRVMSPSDFQAAAHAHVDWIAKYLEDVRDYPVSSPTAFPGFLTTALPSEAPQKGEPAEQIFADFKNIIFPGLTLWNHPKFFAYFSVSATPPSILAELLASAVNVNAMLWRASPAATELEQVTLGWLRAWLRLSQSWFGLIYDTASIGVFQAIGAAREWVAPECRVEGMHGGLTIYISEHTHSSAEKGAIALGFGQRQVRKIGVDEQFRMRPDLLKAAIEADIQAGLRPCCIVASIGSTSTAAIDPVPAIADIAEEYNAWLHVDAAYGGSAAVVSEMAHILDGVERAHSFLVNPHKWLYVGIDCSVLYTRFPAVLRQSSSLQAEYLRTPEDDTVVNFMDYGVQLGRRFRALKLWYVFRFYGREGIESLLRESLRLARHLKSLIEAAPDFQVAAPVQLSLVCFLHRSGNSFNELLLSTINRSGRAFLSHTVLRGQYVLRFAIGNYQTTEADIDETWTLILDTAHSLSSNQKGAGEPSLAGGESSHG